MEDAIYKYLFVKNNAYEMFGFDEYKELLRAKLLRDYPTIALSINIDSLALKLVKRYRGVGIILSIDNTENELLMKAEVLKSLSGYMELVEECGYGELLEKVKYKLTNKHGSSTLEPAVLTNETITVMLRKGIIKKDGNNDERYRYIYK